MIAPLVVLAVIVLALAAFAGSRAIRFRWTPPELRGDWWEQFEREFRAYAAQSSRPRNRRIRQPRDRRSTES